MNTHKKLKTFAHPSLPILGSHNIMLRGWSTITIVVQFFEDRKIVPLFAKISQEIF